MIHFGIDMASNLDDGELTRIANALGPVKFCGRYAPVFAVTPAEIAYLHARGGALLCLDNESQDGAALGGSYQDGRAHGQRAATRWKALGAPDGVGVFLDVEQSFFVSPAYLAGWADGCATSGMGGGCYINSVAGVGHNESYSNARTLTRQPIPIFASEPQPFALANQVADVWEPAAPDGHFADVCVWQYCINFGASDLDMATDAGMALMWSATPPKPPAPTYPYPAHVIAPGALKTTASHASDPAIDMNHARVWLEVGAEVSVLGPDQHSDDDWTPVNLSAPEQQVHGWFLASHLRKD